jgi:hypothetical protein
MTMLPADPIRAARASGGGSSLVHHARTFPRVLIYIYGIILYYYFKLIKI